MADKLHHRSVATVTGIHCAVASFELVDVDADRFTGKAINYPTLTGSVEVGDEVLINTTAVELGLGTGGVHVVIANLSRQSVPRGMVSGHIMKLRYTPNQTNVLCVEEDEHPAHRLIVEFKGLDGKPVVLGMLHSMIAPAAAGLRAAWAEKLDEALRVAYIMTDSAALPMAFSDLVRALKATGLIDTTLTCGQAFGGDRECVNLYTALAAASDADALIVAPGPGHVGTGTPLGFSGIEQGHHIDVVNQLGGRPIVIPRISFAEERQRHRGLSHHTITILTRACHTRAAVVVPLLPEERSRQIRQAFQQHGIDSRHDILVEDGKPAIENLHRHSIGARSMGRTPLEDPAFFLAAGAAGMHAGKLVLTDRQGEPR